MTMPNTGVILAGGNHQRLPGINKALVTIGRKRVIDYLLDSFRDLFREIIIVTNEPTLFLDTDALIVSDLYNTRSSLNGIYSGLFHASASHAFFTACDMPFIKKELIQTICHASEPQISITIPQTQKGFEPLCAVYGKTCLRPIEDQIAKGIPKIMGFFNRVKVKAVPESLLRQADPELESFFNVNTPDDLANAKKHVNGST